jgi:integrase
MKLKLNERVVEALVGPAGETTKNGKPVKDRAYFFDAPQGLGVRVDAAARAGSLAGKSYFVQFSVNGVKRRMPIGACSAIDTAKAEKIAKKHIGAAANDRDPFAERQAAKRKQERDAYTFGVLIDNWAELGLTTNTKKGPRSPRYVAQAPAVVRRVFKTLLDKPAATIDRNMVVPVHDALAKTAPIMAARAVTYAGVAYAWAIKRGALKDNPFAKLETAPTAERDRVLADEELKRIWDATAQPGTFNALVRLLMLTGQRRLEVGGIAWDEISPDGATWTLPGERAKNNNTHLVPLSTQAQAIVAAQPRSNRTPLIFPGLLGDNVFNGWGRAKLALDQASGVQGWVLHDLRRTCATNLQKLGVRLEVTEAVLNHVGGSRAGIVGVYQRHEWADEKRAALQAWADRVEAIAEGRAIEASNVIALRR